MKLNKNDKKELSSELSRQLKAKDTVFAAFQGLKFKDTNTLRESLRPARSTFKVVRNTIISHAISGASLDTAGNTITKGPTAVVTIEDPNEIAKVAKTLLAFAKTNPLLKIKGGFSSQKWLSPQDLEKLSQIGSKPELLSQLASLLYNNLAQIRFVLEAPTRDLACALEALREKKAKEAK
ncbi:MAG: 50S ribosomal protein L10 [Elusimicrobia bacterium]|nr:50S ribosomal protein L10 [Elusimicrobiota bacterium]